MSFSVFKMKTRMQGGVNRGCLQPRGGRGVIPPPPPRHAARPERPKLRSRGRAMGPDSALLRGKECPALPPGYMPPYMTHAMHLGCMVGGMYGGMYPGGRAGCSPEACTLAPKERRRAGRARPELPKEDLRTKSTEAARTMVIYGRISNGNSDRNYHVPRPQKGGKTPTTAVQGFQEAERAHKSDIYGRISEGNSDRNGAVPAPRCVRKAVPGRLNPTFLIKRAETRKTHLFTQIQRICGKKWVAHRPFKVPIGKYRVFS